MLLYNLPVARIEEDGAYDEILGMFLILGSKNVEQKCGVQGENPHYWK